MFFCCSSSTEFPRTGQGTMKPYVQSGLPRLLLENLTVNQLFILPL